MLDGDGTVERNSVSGCYGAGIWLGGIGRVAQNNVSRCVRDGITLRDGTVEGNQVSGCGRVGIVLTGTGSSPVRDNIVTGNNVPISQGPGDPVYSGNTMSSNTNNVIGVSGMLEQDVVWKDVQGGPIR